MKNFVIKIGLDKSLAEKLLAFQNRHNSKIENLTDKCNRHGFGLLASKNDMLRLAVCVRYALKYTKPQYEKLGISLDVFYATMYDISVWCENNGNKGLKNYGWIKNHLVCELFRLGRLQFQMFTMNNPTLNYKKTPFKKGEKMIYVHIPQGEKLDTEKCKESLLLSKNFFEKYFPSHTYRYYFCESWLLFENNKEFMKKESNILRFQSLFEILYSVTDESQALERIFGGRKLFKKNYGEKTSLQKSAKEYILNGGSLGVGIGIIDKEKIQ